MNAMLYLSYIEREDDAVPSSYSIPVKICARKLERSLKVEMREMIRVSTISTSDVGSVVIVVSTTV